MPESKGRALSEEDIRRIEKALCGGVRVELVRTEKGLKIYAVKRKELNQ